MIQNPFSMFTRPIFSMLLAVFIAFSFDMSSVNAQIDSGDVTVETFDGTQVEFQLSSIASDGSVGGIDVPDGLNVADFLTLTNVQTEELAKRQVQVLLANDSMISVSDFSSDGQAVDVISKVVTGPFPFECVKAVIWKDSKKVQSAIRNRSSENDQVVVDTGEEQVIVSGLLERITEDKVLLNYNGESKKISRSIVLAIVTADLQPASPEGTWGSLTLTDGSVVNGAIKSMTDGMISVLMDDRNSIELSMVYVDRIDVKSDRIVFLADLTPSESDQRTYFGVERKPRMNESVSGNPLTLKGPSEDQPLVFARGIGMQSYSRMVFDVPQGFDRFQATVGIDLETKGRGDCVVELSADGIQIFQERVLGSDDPRKVDVDVAGASQLTLTVQTGKQFDLSDHVDWCNARFLDSK